MTEVNIKLNSMSDVKEFVAITSARSYDISLQLGEKSVDAKSAMSIFGLDLTKTLKLKADCKTAGELFHQLKKFIVK